ncbi:hypothetical protein D9M68_697300 [compost metagenome]
MLLDKRALFFDDQNLIQVFDELFNDLRIEGIGHAQLQKANTLLLSSFLGQAQVGQGAAHVRPAFSCGHDAQFRHLWGKDYPVEPVGARIGDGSGDSMLVKARFHF